MDDRCKKELAEFKKLQGEKQKWYSMWQLLGEYIHTRKQDFQNVTQQGEFLTDQIFDSTGPKALRSFGAALKGMIWQSAKSSMKLIPTDDLLDDGEVKDYFTKANKKVANAMDDIKAGLDVALDEYLGDQGCFGTSGIGVFSGDETELVFKSYGVETIAIKESASGYVDTVYNLFEMSAEQVIEKWPSAPPHIQEMVNNNQGDKQVKILHCVKPRTKRDTNKKNNLNMAYMSKYIDYDKSILIHESGFEEQTIFISRFYKRRLEVFGRSPAMDALSDIMHLNVASEARLLAIEKSLDPPLGVAHDSIVGNGVIDTSAGGINVVEMSKTGQNPIFPLFSVGTIREVDKSIEELRESVMGHFLLDRLLDTNNKTQMTLGEVQIRNQIRAESLGSIFARLIRECINPLVERSVSILFTNGELGKWEIGLNEAGEEVAMSDDIPQALLAKITAGEDFYEVSYNTPAMRIIKSEEAMNIQRVMEFAAGAANVNGEVLDKIDVDKALDDIASIYGTNILKSNKEVQQIRQAKAQEQQMQNQAMAAQAEAEIVKTQGEAQQAQAG